MSGHPDRAETLPHRQQIRLHLNKRTHTNVYVELQAHVAFRVLWFTTIKACINTVMVLTGWKKSGVFKVTPKRGQTAEDAAVSTKIDGQVRSCVPKEYNRRCQQSLQLCVCLLYTSPSPRDRTRSRMPSSA